MQANMEYTGKRQGPAALKIGNVSPRMGTFIAMTEGVVVTMRDQEKVIFMET